MARKKMSWFRKMSRAMQTIAMIQIYAISVIALYQSLLHAARDTPVEIPVEHQEPLIKVLKPLNELAEYVIERS